MALKLTSQFTESTIIESSLTTAYYACNSVLISGLISYPILARI